MRDAARPIVLIPRRADSDLPDAIAPGLREIGAMLPYSPLHHLLLESFGRPLVATSGNVSGEPVLTDNAEAEARLGKVAQAFLHHNRPIARPADDSVLRIIADRPRLLRAGRGIAPLEFDLPFTLPQPLLAVGGHMKNSVALGWDNRAVILAAYRRPGQPAQPGDLRAGDRGLAATVWRQGTSHRMRCASRLCQQPLGGKPGLAAVSRAAPSCACLGAGIRRRA